MSPVSVDKTPVRVAVTGASGRMGQEILKLIEASDQFQLAGALSRSEPAHPVSRLDQLKAEEVDVLIDFSSPEYFKQILLWCQAHKKALVSGTTGIDESLRQKMTEVARTTPLLYAANMSLGVAVVSEMIKLFGRIASYDFAIEEFHHRHKKDLPSGTAFHLKRVLEEAIGKTSQTACVRGGGIFGVHRVVAMGMEETITVDHTALNRTVFASGALRAALWMTGRPAGLYSMANVLGLQ